MWIELHIGSEYWDQPGTVQVLIDQHSYWQGSITGTYCDPDVIRFPVTLGCDQSHRLEIRRSNKTPDQCRVDLNGQLQDQMLRLFTVCIDGIKIQNKVWHESWFEPDYHEEWAQQQKSQGIELEHKVIGETWWGHNGTWKFDFSSPFYRFLINEFK